MRIMSLSNTFNKIMVCLALVCALHILCSIPLKAAGAASSENTEGQELRKILVVYSTEQGEPDDSVRILDLVLGHFTADLVFVSDDQVTEEAIRDSTHVVYYGKVSRSLPEQCRQLLTAYRGPLLVIGENIEQLAGRFSFLEVLGKTEINKVSKDASSYQLLDQNYPAIQVLLRQGEAVYQGWRGEYSIPLLSVHEGDAYFATSNLDAPFIHFLGEGLYSFFGEKHKGERLAYIRLEDVHPFSDPNLVKEAGEYLADKQIPFMIAVIPVYTNQDTHAQYRLKDKPEMVKVLRDLQARGASIILHGYTHQYRSSETGEGFEFWDVENNIPISGPPDSVIEVKRRHHFSSEAQYEAYLRGRLEFQESYTRERLEKGIQELTELGLYPLGFEAPHYTMSLEGYRWVSEYFTYLLGQTQLGNEDWHHMSTAPYVTSPSFLGGMTLLPETVGYYDPESLTPIGDFAEKLEQMSFIEDGMIGMFYHPYLGVKGLRDMISYAEEIPGLRWIDMKTLEHRKSEKFSAVDRSDRPYTGDSFFSKLAEFWEAGTVQKVLWIVTAVVTFMVIAFLLYTLRIRLSLRKQLFEERRNHG